MSANGSVFWDDLAANMGEKEFRRTFVLESIRARTMDSIVNQLSAAQRSAKLSASALADAVDSRRSTIRRVLNATPPNISFEALSNIAAALGYRLVLEPMDPQERAVVTRALVGREINAPDTPTEADRVLRDQ
ncbi:helix-turn-helix domain-containing protein [Nocardia grenadensis]|uniref:helix-turn-helix domain-containing protein n=1 Tax=Nocardia grenadensis TaxID=931537 RepID=UPI000B328A8A|nr:helix-turn-helix domain-containing protein [Nocardia grenadensis]